MIDNADLRESLLVTVTVPIRIVDAEGASPEDFEVSVTTPDGKDEKLLVTG